MNKTTWICVICKRDLHNFDKFLLSSYRFVDKYDHDNFERICVDCLKSKHNFTKKGGKY